MTDLPNDIERELAALADGSLTAERRDAALQRASSSRELEDALAEQRRAVSMFAAVEVRAPSAVHRQVEQLLAPARKRRMPSSMRIGFAGAAAAVLAAVAIVLGVSGGGSRELSVQQAAALTLDRATMGAPAENRAHRAQLAAAVGGVPFPYWEERFGWRGVGARKDMIAERSIMTVFYSNAQGRRIGYSIVSGPAPWARGGRVVTRWGVQYRVLAQGDATVVAWRRDGRLCVLGGRGVSAHTLLGLASWGSERLHSA